MIYNILSRCIFALYNIYLVAMLTSVIEHSQRHKLHLFFHYMLVPLLCYTEMYTIPWVLPILCNYQYPGMAFNRHF